MHFEQFYVGCLAHASYLLLSGEEAVVCDPQRDVEIYLEAAKRHGATSHPRTGINQYSTLSSRKPCVCSMCVGRGNGKPGTSVVPCIIHSIGSKRTCLTSILAACVCHVQGRISKRDRVQPAAARRIQRCDQCNRRIRCVEQSWASGRGRRGDHSVSHLRDLR